MFSRRDLTNMIIPLLIEQIFAHLIGMADTVMVAQAGAAAVSGVSLVDSVNLLILYFLGSLSTGGAIVLSQAIGSGRTKNTKQVIKQLVWVSFLVGVALSVIMVFSRKALLRLIFGAISAEIMANAQVYFLYTALSYPFIALRNAIGAAYRSFGNTTVSMYVTFVANIINICGNALLIFVFHMGAAGAAIATLVARIIGAAIVVVLACNKRSIVYIENILSFKPDFKLIKRILSIGIPSGFENSVFQLGKVITQSVVSTFGSVAIAANAAANTLSALLYIPGNAVGPVMTTVVGQCIGAREQKQAKRYALRLLGVVYAIIIIIALILSLLAPQLVGLFNLPAESTELAIGLFLFHNICVSTIWPVAFTLPNAFRAASDVRYTMILSIASMWIFRVGGSFFFAKYLEFGAFGVWLGMACDWVFRATLFGIRYLRGTWLTKYH